LSEAKKTPFYDKHKALHGKIVDYNGWLLPVQYEKGLVEEVHDTRKKATIFDVSHMGEIMVEGKNAIDFLQKLVTNDVSKLKDKAIMYSPVCYPDGGVVDDILIYRLAEDKFFLVVNAANTEKDYNWIKENTSGQVTISNLSSEYAQIAIQGPNSVAILGGLTEVPLGKMKYYHFENEVKFDDINCLVSRTGYTGEDGFELYCSKDDASRLWDVIWEAGKEVGLSPAGLGARDVLRFEASLPLYGHELSKEITPLQAGLHRFVAFDKTTKFIGYEALEKQIKTGLPYKLFGIEMLERGVPREGYRIIGGEQDIGWISSGSFSPTLDKFLGMAFLIPAKVANGTDLQLQIRNRYYKAQVISMPFYRRVK